MDLLVERMIRAAKLEPEFYEEVEANPESMGQAVTVVIIASIAAGIGSMGRIGILGIVLGTIGALISWIIWAYIIYVIGTKIMPETQTSSSMGELLRTIGFSSAPGIIRVLGIIPAFYSFAFLVGNIWMTACMVIAVRQALDYTSTWRAVGVCISGWFLMFIAVKLLGAAMTWF